MTADEYQTLLAGMKPAHRLHHKLHDQLAEKGMTQPEIVVTALGAAFMRTSMLMGTVPAIEFVRNYLDTIEAQHIAEMDVDQ